MAHVHLLLNSENRDWPITVKFRIHKQTSKPQTNYHWTVKRAALKHGIQNPETETEYGIRERRFQAIDLKKNVSNDKKITQQIKRKDIDE